MGCRIDLMTGLKYSLTQQEIDRRHNLIREFMDKQDIGVLMIFLPDREGYRRWLTGVDGTERRTESCFIIPEHGKILHVLGNQMMVEAENMEQPVGAMPDPEEPYEGVQTVYAFSADTLSRAFSNNHKRRLGIIHGSEMRASMHSYLVKYLPGIEWIDVSEQLAIEKAVKSAEEIEIIEKAARLHERILEGLCGYLKAGMLEREAVQYIRYLANHLDSGGIDTMMSAQVQLISWNHKQEKTPLLYPGRYISEGDIVQVKLRIQGDSGYYGIIGRCLALGAPKAETDRCWKQLIWLQNLIEEKLRPGISIKEVMNAVEAAAAEAGIKVRTKRNWLHGIGYCISEVPDEESHSDMLPLEEGMILAVEPEIEDSEGNIMCCADMYQVIPNGARRMTQTAQNLKMIV